MNANVVCPMLVIISRDRGVLATVTRALASSDLPPAVAASGVGVALGLLEDNPVHAVLVHEPSYGSPITRAVGRRFPEVECIGVIAPVDVESVVARVTIACGGSCDADSVVARGSEEFLSLLALTCGSAAIEVSAGRAWGELAVRDGHLVDARVGLERGWSAALRILSWPDARIRSRPLRHAETSMETSMEIPLATALHHSAQRLDEQLRLDGRADVDLILAPVRALPGWAHTLLLDVDHGTILVHHGPPSSPSPRRAWDAAQLCAANSAGLALWDEGGLVVAESVGSGCILVATFTLTPSLHDPRRARRSAASALASALDGPALSSTIFQPAAER
ncbi:MAG: DUF4388 domain-containing protein [Myxococcota bacterium]